MGIFAKGSQFPANVEADTPQNRYGGQLTKDSVAGDALGETIGDVNATASSANTTVGELIDDIESLEGRVSTLENDPGPDLSVYAKTSRVSTLEGRVTTLENDPGPDLSGYATTEAVDTKVSNAFEVATISGTGWSARKQGNLIVLTIYGATTGWTMPTGWTPAATTFAPAVSRVDSANVLARVSLSGSGAVGLHDSTGAFYASIPYFTP